MQRAGLTVRSNKRAGRPKTRPRTRNLMIGATAVYVRYTDDNPVISETSSRSIDPMSTVLIIGASRGIGIETVKLALKAGHSVRAMARSASAIRLRDPKLQKLDGDAPDQHTIERALAGANAVIQTLGVSPTPELIFRRNAPVFRRHSCPGQCNGAERS